MQNLAFGLHFANRRRTGGVNGMGRWGGGGGGLLPLPLSPPSPSSLTPIPLVASFDSPKSVV